MLKGHGSLKMLLGRSVVSQKGSNSATKRDHTSHETRKRSRESDAEHVDDGNIRCPICGEVFSAETADAHVGARSMTTELRTTVLLHTSRKHVEI